MCVCGYSDFHSSSYSYIISDFICTKPSILPSFPPPLYFQIDWIEIPLINFKIPSSFIKMVNNVMYKTDKQDIFFFFNLRLIQVEISII